MFLEPGFYLLKNDRVVKISNCKGAVDPDTGERFMVVDWREGAKLTRLCRIEERHYKKWKRLNVESRK